MAKALVNRGVPIKADNPKDPYIRDEDSIKDIVDSSKVFGKTLDLSGTDLSLKNGSTVLSTVTLPGGGGGSKQIYDAHFEKVNNVVKLIWDDDPLEMANLYDTRLYRLKGDQANMYPTFWNWNTSTNSDTIQVVYTSNNMKDIIVNLSVGRYDYLAIVRKFSTTKVQIFLLNVPTFTYTKNTAEWSEWSETPTANTFKELGMGLMPITGYSTTSVYSFYGETEEDAVDVVAHNLILYAGGTYAYFASIDEGFTAFSILKSVNSASSSEAGTVYIGDPEYIVSYTGNTGKTIKMYNPIKDSSDLRIFKLDDILNDYSKDNYIVIFGKYCYY